MIQGQTALGLNRKTASKARSSQALKTLAPIKWTT